MKNAHAAQGSESCLSIRCAVCAGQNLISTRIVGLERAICPSCHHSQRVDIEKIDYTSFTMGRSGMGAERMNSQIQFLEKVELGDALLEIGCASGSLAQALRARHTLKYDGIEISPAAEAAKLVIDKVFGKSVCELLSDGDISPASYSFIIMSHCLEHLAVKDLHEQIGAMKTALTPSGFLFLEVPNQSGHHRLPFDDNRSHIHFFSLNSLCRLLSDCGLTVVAAETGAKVDARYTDSIRVLCTHFTASTPAVSPVLSDHQLLNGIEQVIIWGAGKLSEELLEHYFDLSRISFFVDSNQGKQGSTCLGLPIRDPAVLAQCSDPVVLINSLEFEDSIRRQLKEQFPGVRRVIGIGELLS